EGPADAPGQGQRASDCLRDGGPRHDALTLPPRSPGAAGPAFDTPGRQAPKIVQNSKPVRPPGQTAGGGSLRSWTTRLPSEYCVTAVDRRREAMVAAVRTMTSAPAAHRIQPTMVRSMLASVSLTA